MTCRSIKFNCDTSHASIVTFVGFTVSRLVTDKKLLYSSILVNASAAIFESVESRDHEALKTCAPTKISAKQNIRSITMTHL